MPRSRLSISGSSVALVADSRDQVRSSEFVSVNCFAMQSFGVVLAALSAVVPPAPGRISPGEDPDVQKS